MNLTQWETIAGIAESVATVIALLVAGVWTYRLFIKNRTSYPRVALEIKSRVQDISESCRIVRVEIHVTNEGQVLLPVGDLERSGPAFLDSFRGGDKWKPAMVKLPPRGAEIRAI